ncbi:kelch repeat-containing protein [Hymenobacter metallicola]|nr:kelch repeat-containing protein [Hymenobacter metallicola]
MPVSGPLPLTARQLVALGRLTESRTLAPWVSLANLSQIRGQHAAVASGNRIYVWGGYIGNSTSTVTEFSSLEIYNPATNTWTTGAPVPKIMRGQACAVGADGQIYSISGVNNGSPTLTDTYRYNPATNVWTSVAPIPVGQWESAAATGQDGKIYVFGGTSNQLLTQIYTPSTNTWTTGANMPVGRHGHVAVTDANGLIHLIGGMTELASAALASHSIYNPATNTWTSGTDLPSAVNQPGGTLGADGKLYITGGKGSYFNNEGPFYNSVYVYDPATSSWTSGTNLPITLAETRSVSIGSDIYTIAGANGSMQSVLYRSSVVVNSFTWTGTTSTAWNVASNWSGGVVPTANDNVTIPAGLSRYPVVSASSAANLVTVSSGASLGIADGGTLSVSGNFVNNGTFSATGNATVNLNGGAAQTIGGSSITQFRNLTVGSAGASLGGRVEIQRLLTLNGNLTTTGQQFLILSNNVGTGMVYNNGGVVNGGAIMQRYIDPASNPGFGYRHFAPAVSGATFNTLAVFPILPGAQSPGPLQLNAAYNSAAEPGLVTPFPTVFSYNQSRVVAPASGNASFDQGWESPVSANQTLPPTFGLTINQVAGNFFELTGTSLNNGGITRTSLTRGAQPESGWHLLGNPYPSPIDWNRVGRTNVDAAAYVYRSTGQYDGGYTAYVNGVGTNIMPMGQAFFVRTSAAGASGSVAFTNASRETTYTDPIYARPAQTETRPLVQLTLQRVGATGAASQDDFYVYEQAGATSGFDSEYDALKVQLNGGAQPSLYQQVGTDALAIQGLPAGNTPRSLALGLNAAEAGTYEFSPTQLLNLAATEPVWLEDKLTGTWHDLRLGAYRATLPQGLSTTRFVLHLHQAKALSSGKASTWAGELQLYPNPATAAPVTLAASGVAGSTAELVLVNSVGQQVWQRTAPLSGRELRAVVPVAGLAQGVYTVQVRSAAGILTRKLVIQ